jgi:uncharacterized protein involved in cysteine biosynthesis
MLQHPGGPAMRRPPRAGFFLLDGLDGFVAVFHGGVLLFTRPEFAGKLRLPVIANVLLVGVAGAALFFAFEHVLSGWIGSSGDLFGFFAGALSLLLTLVTLYFVLPPIVETAMGPFLEPIADVVERSMGGPRMEPVRRHLWATIVANVRSAAQVLAVSLAALALVILLSFVLLGPPLGLVLSASSIAVVWFELPFYRRGQDLRHRLAVLRRNWARALGFGVGFQVGALIPVFNVFLLAPAATVAASMLYLRMDKTAPVPRPQAAAGTAPAEA